MNDGGEFAVIFACGHDAHGAVAGLEDDDGDHEGGGEAEGEGVSLIEGHVTGSCLGGGRHSPARQAPDVSGRWPQSPRRRSWSGRLLASTHLYGLMEGVDRGRVGRGWMRQCVSWGGTQQEKKKQ